MRPQYLFYRFNGESRSMAARFQRNQPNTRFKEFKPFETDSRHTFSRCERHPKRAPFIITILPFFPRSDCSIPRQRRLISLSLRCSAVYGASATHHFFKILDASSAAYFEGAPRTYCTTAIVKCVHFFAPSRHSTKPRNDRFRRIVVHQWNRFKAALSGSISPLRRARAGPAAGR